MSSIQLNIIAMQTVEFLFSLLDENGSVKA